MSQEARDYALAGNYDEARAAYTMAVHLRNDNPATQFERALVSIQMGDYQAAINDLESVLGYDQFWESPVSNTLARNLMLQVLLKGKRESALTALLPSISDDIPVWRTPKDHLKGWPVW